MKLSERDKTGIFREKRIRSEIGLKRIRKDEGGPRAGNGMFSRRITSNFAVMGGAEIACRAVSFLVSLSLLKHLGRADFGRIEYSFNMVFWLVLIVRDCFETIVTREISRHPRLTRGFANRLLAVKLTVATVLLLCLGFLSWLCFQDDLDRMVMWLYGLLLLTTAMGLDFVFRGRESMGLLALSLILRSAVYFLGVSLFVSGSSRVIMVPLCLIAGEAIGIALVWLFYVKNFGVPKPKLGWRFLIVMVQKGQSVGLIHLCQAVIVSADLLVVGLLNPWEDVGLYSAPLRITTAVMAFGLIFQHVIFPALSRSWRESPESSRRLLDLSVRVLVAGLLPIAVGGSLLANPLVQLLFPAADKSSLLLMIGIWRAPLLCLAFLYQTSMIAANLEAAGVRLLVWGAVGCVSLVAVLQTLLGLPGATLAVLLVGLGLVLAGYFRLAHEGRAPAAHHHLGWPLVASALMVPVCLAFARVHVVAAILTGAVTYLTALKLLGGLDFQEGDWGGISGPTERPLANPALP